MNKAAQALSRLAAGKPKNYSAAEIERRSKILAGINARKRQASEAKKRRMPNVELTDAGPVTPASRETQSRHSVQ